MALSEYPPPARTFITAVILVGSLVTALLVAADWPDVARRGPTILFLGLTAAAADLFPIRIHYDSWVSVSAIVYVFALVVFPVSSVVVLPLVPGIVYASRGLLSGKMAWHRPIFNTAQLSLTLAIAGTTYGALADRSAPALASPRDYFALLMAGLVYFAVNTGMVAQASALVGRLSPVYVWRTNYANLTVYFFGLVSAGGISAVLWFERPLVVPLAAGLGLLLHHALNVPNLVEEARIDGKTGLYNVRHFYRVLESELSRAARFDRPLAVVMADLDLMREINNANGHLVGDIVLKQTADAIRANTREFDTAARFGGEEFVLLLLETTGPEAMEVAERIRGRLEETTIKAPTTGAVVRATVSIGVACHPRDGATAEELVHKADMAMYRAKLAGRNRVFYADAFETVKTEIASAS